MDRVIGLDVGKKRIGIAMSDALLLTAQPVETIERTPEKLAVEKIRNLCNSNSVKKIVIGLPKHMNNTIGEQAQDCLDFAENFSDDFQVIFEDERLSSRQAEGILALQGKKYTKNKHLIDLKSACIILQQYLDRK